MPSSDESTDPAESDASYATTFDPHAGDGPSERIIDAVAALTNEDPLELTPLYEAVDPDALDALFVHSRGRSGLSAASGDPDVDGGIDELWFTYEGFDVGVHSDGEILIQEATQGSSASA
ncbi:hypothetical protein SAMN05444422_106193 [Halobiforma haloterrestris]|uniref:Halobacterial output domain-containing protein n=1 Tax=Natronobacterium haloterrestre TaxID=148448 RepID=A0A1I1HUY2_NATHA|nr:HalOD1 output domain-containing protein [Halobiforma haloterrestris]SFC27959.1 hypothetical protein SAMN05444422_106193 [Halobiforma haloterrestris]